MSAYDYSLYSLSFDWYCSLHLSRITFRHSAPKRKYTHPIPIIHQLKTSMDKFVQTPSQYSFGIEPFASITRCCSLTTTPRKVYLYSTTMKMINLSAWVCQRLGYVVLYLQKSANHPITKPCFDQFKLCDRQNAIWDIDLLLIWQNWIEVNLIKKNFSP